MLLCSCASFDIADWPSSFAYTHNSPTANLCGPIGAFCAYYLLYYLGPGVFFILVCTAALLIARLFGRSVEQLALRALGLTLLTSAASSTFFCLWPDSIFKFPIGSGGIIGVAAVEFLRSHFAVLGTFILITAIWIVGAVLLADRFVIVAIFLAGTTIKKILTYLALAFSAAWHKAQLIGQIAKKLTHRQKPLTVRKLSLCAQKDSHLEDHFEPGEPDQHSTTVKVTQNKSAQQNGGFVPASYKDYTLPPMNLLEEPQHSFSAIQGKVVKAKAAALEKLLSEFNINANVTSADTGPVVTMFELELAAGVKVSQITNLSNDMARALGAGAVRVVAPIPGKHTIGIEVPNNEKEKVRVKDLIELAPKKSRKMHIPLFLGKDSSGDALVSDLAAMPHLLIAGTTGSGKSVCINSIITSILLTKRPDEVKMILVDPKMVEMTAFNAVPHLMSPIVTETKRAVQILEWATVKMDERYSLLAEAHVKNIAGYNTLGAAEIIERFNPTTADEEAKIPKTLPYIVIIIDELADLMMTAPKEIEAFIVRLAQKSRAVGIHLVVATQRPQATVVTGLIKSNMPTRIGFRVAARMDSRIILDQNGAETLLGQGDMLFLKPGTSDLIRAQGTFVDDAEIKRIVKHLKEIAQPQFHPELTQLGRMEVADMVKDELFDDAVQIVMASKRGSVSLLQRRLSIGYARASRIIEMMAASGILGEYKGSQAREILVTPKEFKNIQRQMQADADAGYKDLADEEEYEHETTEDENLESQQTDYPTEGQKEYAALEDEEE